MIPKKILADLAARPLLGVALRLHQEPFDDHQVYHLIAGNAALAARRADAEAKARASPADPAARDELAAAVDAHRAAERPLLSVADYGTYPVRLAQYHVLPHLSTTYELEGAGELLVKCHELLRSPETEKILGRVAGAHE